jgi:hypothetical protein
MKQIFPESPGANLRSEIAIGRCNHPHIDAAQLARLAEPRDLAPIERP